jgi:solute carrier family 25 (mitochondrial phosphate transporter), member 23/24/25/41
MPESAIKFGSYEVRIRVFLLCLNFPDDIRRLTLSQGTKRIFAALEGVEDSKQIHSYSKFVAGGVAGMISQYVIIIVTLVCNYRHTYAAFRFASYPIDTLKL